MDVVDSNWEPEKEPLEFTYDDSEMSEDGLVVMESIRELAESMLYHWKRFPITLPPSMTDLKADGSSKRTSLNFQDLFKAPTFDELDKVALDDTGSLKKLDKKQLQSVWKNGEFEVDSLNFPGQVHRWRLTNLLQKGSERARDSLLNDVALALKLLIIQARNRFCSKFFSVSQSFRSLGKAAFILLDILIGMPSNSYGNLDSKIQDEHMRHLVAELDIKPKHKKDFDVYCQFVRSKIEQLQTDTTGNTAIQSPPIPHVFLTPNGQEIDLRLFNKDLINNCLPILSSILDRAAKGWHVQFRQRMTRELQGKGMSNKELSERVNEAIMQEYRDRVFHAVCNNTELENLHAGIGQLLVAQAKTALAMQKAVEKLQSKMATEREQRLTALKVSHPVKSRIQTWMEEQLLQFEEEFVQQHQWSAHEEAISMCEEQNLQTAVYFLKRDLHFIKQRENILVKELGRVKIPNRKYTFYTRIWFPWNYVVIRQTGNVKETIPAVISKSSNPNKHETLLDDSSRATYEVHKYSGRTTSSRYPFWRWWNYLNRTWAWTWNAMFMFGVVIPWCSPISLRALFYPKPFTPDLELSHVNGQLYPDKSSTTQTLCSRLTALWQHVWTSRKRFEDTPDQGFLGKSFTRHINRLWNYVLKGACGTVILVTCFPILCLVASLSSLVSAITAPVWMPMLTLVTHLFFFLVLDMDCPDTTRSRLLYLLQGIFQRFLLGGILQPVAAIVTGCVLCPLAAVFVSAFGVIRRAGRGLWDTFMFYAVIRHRGRVPSNDSFVARRIAGPGLASEYFFQITVEQALAALEARLEMDELDAWKNRIIRIIEAPKDKYISFVRTFFRPFSAEIIQEGVYKRLCTETSKYLSDLTVQAKGRERKLNIGLSVDAQRKIKLPERELKLCILHAAKMLEDFYVARMFPKMSIQEDDFWEGKQLEQRDWRGLACKKFVEIFSDKFLVPLEESDNLFHLEVNHLNMGRYLNMLTSGDFEDDLDSVSEVHSSEGEITSKSPKMKQALFDPNNVIKPTAAYLFTKRSKGMPWNQKTPAPTFDRMQIPLPLPHPASIIILIYNRDNDQNPLKYDDMYCQRIIKATQAKASVLTK